MRTLRQVLNFDRLSDRRVSLEEAVAKYLIHATHEPLECLKLLDNYLQAGAHYLTHAEWGCEAGVHEQWMIVEAQDDASATLMVPPILRNQARVVRLNRFTPDDIRAMHAEGK
jgi:hypothetical protein